MEKQVFKTATLSTFKECPSFTPIYLGSKSILKVAITLKNLNMAKDLEIALKKLNKSDPSLDVQIFSNGDIIIGACG